MDIYEQAGKINSQHDFSDFLKSLKKNLQENKDEWENDSLESFFDGLQGYCMDKQQEVPTWKVFAELLLAARVYE
jgi:hypothetical protein